MRWSPVVALIAVLAAAGCGSNSCQDAVNASGACAAKLNTSSNLTLDACNAATCTNKQGYIDCVVGLSCSDLASYTNAYNACVTGNACQ